MNCKVELENFDIGVPVALNSVPGGGTLPDVKIPSFGIEIDHDISKELEKEQQRICQLLRESKTERLFLI